MAYKEGDNGYIYCKTCDLFYFGACPTCNGPGPEEMKSLLLQIREVLDHDPAIWMAEIINWIDELLQSNCPKGGEAE